MAKKVGSEARTVCNDLADDYHKDIQKPWYVGTYGDTVNGYYLDSATGYYRFAKLEQLFTWQGKPIGSMGLQPNYTQEVNNNYAMRKEENDQGVTTTDTINWDAATNRGLIFNNNLDTTSGYSNEGIALTEKKYDIERSDNREIIWKTDW